MPGFGELKMIVWEKVRIIEVNDGAKSHVPLSLYSFGEAPYPGYLVNYR